MALGKMEAYDQAGIISDFLFVSFHDIKRADELEGANGLVRIPAPGDERAYLIDVRVYRHAA